MDIQTVDFYDLESLGSFTYYKPVSLEFYGVTIEFSVWRYLYVRFVELVYKRCPGKIDKLANSRQTNLVVTADRVGRLVAGKHLGISNFYFETNFSALDTLKSIKELITYCNLDVSKIIVRYTSRGIAKRAKRTSTVCSSANYTSTSYTAFRKNPNDSLSLSLIEPFGIIPQNIKDVILADYPNGFDFNRTTINLLESKTGSYISEEEQRRLKMKMYRRGDDLYFLHDSIVDRQVRLQISEYVNVALDNFRCFELNALYELFGKNFNSVCIRNLEDFEEWFVNNFAGEVKTTNCYGVRIVRLKSTKMDDVTSSLIQRIVYELKKAGGTLEEEKLLTIFDAFSINFLNELMRQEANDVICCQINGRTCYQTFDALGIPEEFSEELSKVLEKIDELGLEPDLEIINALLSVALNYNFRSNFNIPNDKTYRRLLQTCYQGTPRVWKDRSFRALDE